MNWIEFSIKTTGQAIEAVSEILNRFGANGVAINDPNDLKDSELTSWDYIDESLKTEEEFVQIKAYYPDEGEAAKLKIEDIQKTILSIKDYIDLGEAKIETKIVCDEDWANEWKKHYKPFKIGDRILIKPSWENVNKEAQDIIIELDPGMAFGTGTHESTRMCLELLDKYMKKGYEVLDVGCGSGILSITAAKLDASKVLAIDIDSVAVKTSQDNAASNSITHLVEVRKSVIEEIQVQKYNIVVANIIADVIISISNTVKLFLKDQGIFIVSGIIKDRAIDVKSKLSEMGFEIVEEKSDGEWVAIAVRLR